MVMKESMKQCEINSPTLKEYKIIRLEETLYSTDGEDINLFTGKQVLFKVCHFYKSCGY